MAWTNATTRATALTTQNGVYVKSGTTTKRYLGSVYINATGGQTDDSIAKRYVFNYYNRVLRRLYVNETTDSWAYTTATIRQANGAAANQLDVMVGVAEDALAMQLTAHVINTNANVQMIVGIGDNVTNAFASGSRIGRVDNLNTSSIQQITAEYVAQPAEGRRFYPWCEYSQATGATTWYGDNAAPTLTQSGLSGVWRC